MFVPSTDVEKNDTVHYIDLIRSPILRWEGGEGVHITEEVAKAV